MDQWWPQQNNSYMLPFPPHHNFFNDGMQNETYICQCQYLSVSVHKLFFYLCIYTKICAISCKHVQLVSSHFPVKCVHILQNTQFQKPATQPPYLVLTVNASFLNVQNLKTHLLDLHLGLRGRLRLRSGLQADSSTCWKLGVMCERRFRMLSRGVMILGCMK